MKRTFLSILMGLMFLIFISSTATGGNSKYGQGHLLNPKIPSKGITFTENKGQFGEITKFKCESPGAVLYFTQGEVAYLLTRETDELIEYPEDMIHHEMDELRELRPRYKKEAILVKAKFLDSNPDAEIIGEGKLPHYYNYFLGNDHSKWAKRVANYSSVVYKNIYPSIDLKYYGNGNSIKYDFIVHPGSDPSVIKIQYEGIKSLSVNEKGKLIVSTSYREIIENNPVIFQAKSEGISGAFYKINENTFGFRLNSKYDANQELIIDPELLFSTYLGGSIDEYVGDLSLDSDGNAIISGYTFSSDFPLVNPYDSQFGGDREIFVSKLSSDGSSLLFSTFIGGSSYESGRGNVLGSEGNIYVCGYTFSNDYPLVNPFDDSLNSQEAVISILNSSGDSLIYSSYFGGSEQESAFDITLDDDDFIYLSGYTYSGDFPLVNPIFATFGGIWDAFIAKFTPNGQSLIFSTYFGGSDRETSNKIMLDNDQNIILCGYTKSSDLYIVNAVDSLNESNNYDGYIAKISSSYDSLIFSTYLGGREDEQLSGVDLDDDDNIYVCGNTFSDDFPIKNAFDSTYGGFDKRDGFITIISPSCDSLIFSSFIGGDRDHADDIEDISVDNNNHIHVTGWTYSEDFPIKNPFDDTFNGDKDIVVMEFSQYGEELIYSTYFGTETLEIGDGIAVDSIGNTIITGVTWALDFPVLNAYDSTNNGIIDLYVSKFSPAECLDLTLTPHTIRVPNDNGYIHFDIDLFNCGVTSIPVEAQLHPIIIDCVGTPYTPGFMNRTLTTLLSPGSYFSDSYYIITDNVTGLGSGGVQIVAGHEIDKWLDVDCFEIIFTYPWGRKTGNESFGFSEWGEVNHEDNIPREFSLSQNYPNPFNSSTTIEYTLPVKSHVILEIYNILGQKVDTIINGKQNPGNKSITWHANQYVSGIYFCKLEVSGEILVRTITLIK